MTQATARRSTPLKRITSGQVRALHAIGRARGLDHEALRDAAGVESLTHLSVTEAARLIERLQTKSHRRDWSPGEPPDRASARGVIRLATERQRNYIAYLFDQLGWDAEKAAGWLQKRHGIRDVAGGTFSARAASEAITQLEHAALKASHGSSLEDVSTGD